MSPPRPAPGAAAAAAGQIDPDAAYPNGFADPDDPFGNECRGCSASESGFDWGLLGLLGLLGLIPLFRGNGRVSRTVYVERDDPSRAGAAASGSRRNREGTQSLSRTVALPG